MHSIDSGSSNEDNLGDEEELKQLNPDLVELITAIRFYNKIRN